jgi:ABC-type bacteriocin/lantibiotic exporter with double-glycine peptidase domain
MPENSAKAIACELNQIREEILKLRHDYQAKAQRIQAKATELKLEASEIQQRVRQETKPLSRRLYLLENAHWRVVETAEQVLEGAERYGT